MNLKIEDLEREMSMKKNAGESGNDMNSSGFSVTSASFVHASMKEALASTQHGHNVESQKGSLVKDDRKSSGGPGVTEEPPKEYEKML
jgi:hypothetical protein